MDPHIKFQQNLTIRPECARIGVARGAMGAPAPTRAVKKLFRRNLQGKLFVSISPAHQVHCRGRAKVNFRTFLAGRGEIWRFI